MAASERRRRARWLAFVCVAAVVAGACAGGDAKPEPLPPQAVSRFRPDPTPTPPPAAPTVPPPTVIEIAPAEAPEAAPPSLAEAARRERERRQAEGVPPPVAVITNRNLAEFTKGQKLTVAEPAPAAAETPAADEASAAPAGEAVQDEEYWRGRALELRQRWRDAVEKVDRLEAESAELRTQFYAADDPWQRDTQIKPEWDRVLSELERAKRDAEAAPRQLEAFLEEGNRAGALPGWLREGIDLEPEAREPAPPPGEPTEPDIVDEEPRQP